MSESVSRIAFAAAMVAATWLVGSGASPAFASQRVALVIGNAAYAHAPALANPLNDAADVGAALERLGFAVTRLDNAAQVALRRGLQQFALAASASEVAVVFYAGHGIEVDRRNFLVPVDARLASDQDVEFEAVPLELVARAVERASGLRLVILDACRENPFAVQMQREGATRSIGRGLARVEPSGETLIAYAAKEGTVASDGSGRNSPYSEALLAHLEEPGLEVGLLFRKVRDAVLASTGGRQEPFVYGSLSSRGVYLAASPASDSEPAPPASSVPGVASGTARVTAEQLAVERVYWESVKDSQDPADVGMYLERYPGGAYEALARNRLKRLEAAAKDPDPPASTPQPSSLSDRMAEARLAAEAKFWALVEGSEEPGDIETYLEQYPEGVYAPLARMRLSQLRRERSGAQGSAHAAVESGLEAAAGAPAPALSQAASTVAAGSDAAPQALESSLGLERSERRWIQAGLASLGLEPGPADGLFGARTRSAIRRYQGEKGLEETGYLTSEEAQALRTLGEAAMQAEAEARREATGLADDGAFANAKSAGTVEAFATYLEAFPSGRHVVEARRAHEEAVRAEAEARREAAARAEAERVERARREKSPGRRFRECPQCPELVVVPSGTYGMGSPPREKGRDNDEGPVTRVRIAEPIAVGLYEVTFAQWDACRREGGCRHNPSDRGWGRGSRPVINVSWEDAQQYVRWLSSKTGARYRLLSESEWEYVARAGTTTRFHWGDEPGRRRANCDGCGSRWDDRRTAPAGSFSANEFGLHDVHGNVREWVEDCWHDDYSGAPGDGRPWTSGGNCSRRVVRGGSWTNAPKYVRSADRSWDPVGYRNIYVGFRVARTFD